MDAREAVEEALATRGHIDQVYWVGCGGSLIDLMPADYMLHAESGTVESRAYTAREFTVAPPRKLGEHSLVVALSHSGKTPEVLDACHLAVERGAYVFTLTSEEGSPIDDPAWGMFVYVWDDKTPQAELSAGQTLLVAAELMRSQEDYEGYGAVRDGLASLDTIIPAARKKVNEELCGRFSQLCKEHDFLYILGSGATFSQTYGFAICSLMEMQWQNCCYIHSAEYFHGPFECTEPGVFYFLQMSSGPSRVEDERALAFIRQHTDTYLVLDAGEYGMDAVDKSVRGYLEPLMMYYMNVELRAARGRVFDHDPSYRRYMGKVEY